MLTAGDNQTLPDSAATPDPVVTPPAAPIVSDTDTQEPPVVEKKGKKADTVDKSAMLGAAIKYLASKMPGVLDELNSLFPGI